jgi:hypothetical protein
MANPLALDLTSRFKPGANAVFYKPNRALGFGKKKLVAGERPLPQYPFNGTRTDNTTPLHSSLLLSKQECRGLGNIKDHLYGSPHNHTKELPPPAERIDRRGESSVLGGSMRGAPKSQRSPGSGTAVQLSSGPPSSGGSHQQWDRYNQMMGVGNKVSTNPALADFAFAKSMTHTLASVEAVSLQELSTEWRSQELSFDQRYRSSRIRRC